MAPFTENYVFPLFACFLVAGLLAFLHGLYQHIVSPLRGIPGPFLARFSRIWLLGEVYRGTYHLTNIKLHQRYGRKSWLCTKRSLLTSF